MIIPLQGFANWIPVHQLITWHQEASKSQKVLSVHLSEAILCARIRIDTLKDMKFEKLPFHSDLEMLFKERNDLTFELVFLKIVQ